MTLRIGVLETGRKPDDLDHYDDYPTMVGDWLAPLGGEMIPYAALDGALPASPAEADLWVITGSKHGVYDDLPWIAPLEGFIRRARDEGSRMVGICFGHQLMAQALGGRAGKSPKGWGLGVQAHAPVTDWPEDLPRFPDGPRLQMFHQDQVEALPEGAVPLAGSAFCPIGAAWYPGFGVSVQGHPEFAADYARALLETRKGSVYPVETAETALGTVDQPTNRAELAQWIRDTLARF